MTSIANEPKYLYHASWMPSLRIGLRSLLSRGLLPSPGAPGVHFAYTPEDGLYYVEADNAVVFRIRWEGLVAYAEQVPEAGSLQVTDVEVVAPYPIPASLLEVRYNKEWLSLADALSREEDYWRSI